MQITRINCQIVEKDSSRLKAYVSVVFDDCFSVRNMRIIEGKEGLFLVYPSRENTRFCPSCQTRVSYRDSYCKKCGKELSVIMSAAKYSDVCYPVDKKFSQEVEKKVIEEYKRLKGEVPVVEKKGKK